MAAFSQYLLRDDPLGGAPELTAVLGFQTGLEYLNGAQAALLRLAACRSSSAGRTAVSRCGGSCARRTARPSVTVLVQRKGSAHYSKLKTVTTNSLGYWSLHSSTGARTWRVRWVSPSGARLRRTGDRRLLTGPPIGH